MMVFFACGDALGHVGDVQENVQIDASTPRQLIEMLESRQTGWRARLLRPDGTLRSDVALWVGVVRHADGRLLDGENTRSVRSLDESWSADDHNVLVSLFRPDEMVRFLLETLAGEAPSASSRGSRVRLLSSSHATHNSQALFARAEPEPIYGFTSGQPVAQLLAEGEINVQRDQLLPKPLAKALATVLDAPSDLHEFRLRAFQEEMLRHALDELGGAKQDNSLRRPLLLSIPTGGGKTEAFLTPLLAHLLDKRSRARRRGHAVTPAVRAMVVYPTRALANDQARRLTQILLEVNAQAGPDAQLSLGVLTGDTPGSARTLSAQSSLLQLCPRCSAVLTQFEERSRQINGVESKLSIARCICGVEVDCFRFTREDVLAEPPDILVISPDMMSRTLQLPRFTARLFSPHLEAVALDEIHVYSGAFGCHVAHLLRRVEATCGTKPLYLGVSATIRNARQVACALFDAAPEEVRYLRPHARDEAPTEELRPYLDFEAWPTRHRHHYALAPGRVAGGRFARTTTTTVNVTHVLGHLLRDPHFRKMLVFSNGRDATDDIVRFGRDHEERSYLPFSRDLWPRLQVAPGEDALGAVPLSKVEKAIVASMDSWYERVWRSGNLYEPVLEFGWHRGGLETKERLRAVNRFVATRRLSAARGESPWPLDILAATSTLELGLDIGDVSVVVNCGAPFTVNEYTQRIGRGGRRKDALALTVVDPSSPLDRRFLRRFARYVGPRPHDFEAVPLVVANRDVCRAHILARLFDRVAQDSGAFERRAQDNANELCVGHLRRFTISANGRDIRLSDDPRAFAEALWDDLFAPEAVEAHLKWLRREAQLVPGAQQTTLNEEDWRAWWLDKCESLNELISKPETTDAHPLTGRNALDRELVPDLRGVGATVGLFWRTLAGDAVYQDAVALRTALGARPPGGGASQGSLTFRIKSVESDPNAQLAFARLLREPGIERATAYFNRAFGKTRESNTTNEEHSDQVSSTDASETPIFPSKPFDVYTSVSFVTPSNLEIEFSPSRFYCAECGATYSHKKPGDRRCSSCNAELRQINELYACGGCGDTFQPPVPKVCLNPECVTLARSCRTGAKFLDGDFTRVNRGTRHNDYFRFSALPKLHWQCRACQTVINFHAHYELPPAVRRLMDADSALLSPAEKEAKGFLWEPEAWWKTDYQEQGFHSARFSCSKCRDKGTYRKIFVVNAPTSRSALHDYILHGPTIADERRESYGVLSFERVRVLSLARERFETFSSGTRRSPQVKTAPIFPQPNQYLAGLHDAHAGFLSFGEILDEFLANSAIVRACGSGCGIGDEGCACRKQEHSPENEMEVPDDEDDVFTLPGASGHDEETRPVAHLLSWERNRKPDPRRKWCDVVADLVPGAHCPGPYQPCGTCSHFDPLRFKRYLVIHTLEHALLAAMPLYIGATRGQIRGIINPNDEGEHDLALLDTVEGGSGCIYLLQQNWEKVWDLCGEILSEACHDPDTLLLTHGCERFNRDLCPVLAHAFWDFAQGRGT